MSVDPRIDQQADKLIFAERFDQAEKLLIDRYDVAKTEHDQANLEHVLQKLAFLYSFRKDFASAEKAYLRWEQESHDPNLAKVENAFFLFSQAHDYKKALRKAEEIESALQKNMGSASSSEIRILFRALHVKGRSLLKLNRLDEATSALRRINELVQHSPTTAFGFELDFIEECLNMRVALDRCELYLRSAHWSSYDSPTFEPRKNEALRRLNSLRK
jgi:tetratricopeptide (TPR) repeat protein